jgi:hypothetical protein
MPWSSRDKSCSMGYYTSIKQVLVAAACLLPVKHTTILIDDPHLALRVRIFFQLRDDWPECLHMVSWFRARFLVFGAGPIGTRSMHYI